MTNKDIKSSRRYFIAGKICSKLDDHPQAERLREIHTKLPQSGIFNHEGGTFLEDGAAFRILALDTATQAANTEFRNANLSRSRKVKTHVQNN